jgi:hypothetical protein
MANGDPRQGFELRHDATAVFAWGEDVPQAFEAALNGLLNAAGAPTNAEMSGKTLPITATGTSPADLLDNLGLALYRARLDNEPLDGSFQMGGVVRADDGWSGWGTAGLGDGTGEPLDEFQILVPPKVERKPGRVTVKMKIAVLSKKAAESLKQIEALLRQIHPGGVVGPGEFPVDDDDVWDV